jgi:hypothetical protein
MRLAIKGSARLGTYCVPNYFGGLPSRYAE